MQLNPVSPNRNPLAKLLSGSNPGNRVSRDFGNYSEGKKRLSYPGVIRQGSGVIPYVATVRRLPPNKVFDVEPVLDANGLADKLRDSIRLTQAYSLSDVAAELEVGDFTPEVAKELLTERIAPDVLRQIQESGASTPFPPNVEAEILASDLVEQFTAYFGGEYDLTITIDSGNVQSTSRHNVTPTGQEETIVVRNRNEAITIERAQGNGPANILDASYRARIKSGEVVGDIKIKSPDTRKFDVSLFQANTERIQDLTHVYNAEVIDEEIAALLGVPLSEAEEVVRELRGTPLNNLIAELCGSVAQTNTLVQHHLELHAAAVDDFTNPPEPIDNTWML